MNLTEKFRETLISVLPIMAVVLLLGLTIAPLESSLLIRFTIGGVLVILGLTIFLLGIDIGILPIGEQVGAALTSKRNLALLLGISFLIGIMVTIAEPDVQVLANQIKNVSQDVNKWLIIFMIAVGIGLFIVVGLLRTVFSLKLKLILLISYAFLFVIIFFADPSFHGIAFDAGGATTGPMTVPFIMALGVGVSAVKSSKKSTDADSFGLTGIASIGPVAAVGIYGIILRFNSGSTSQIQQAVQESSDQTINGINIFLSLIPEVTKEVSLALLPLVIMFALFQIFLLHMPPVQIRRMIKGIIYSFIGLIIFLTGVNGGFMETGEKLGLSLGKKAIEFGGIWKFLILAVSFIFGAIVVCAEPAVHVLTSQVESISGGTINRKIMLISLSLGVALAISLAMLKTLNGFSLWYLLIPGYTISFGLSIFCPELFTGIAFDSGGVASGPMTSTFILSFMVGCAKNNLSTSATDAFGVIALVAMTPLIAIQILGIIYHLKTKGGTR